MTSIIKMKDIHKRFGSHTVINGLNLEVKRGEAMGLTGPSGVGKSTILRIIAGLETPDSGFLHVGSAHIGYVFQEPRLLPWDTILHNVALPLLAQKADKKEAKNTARNLLHQMELSGFENARPHQLSGGMRQRVALARALAVTPDILLLDEPFTGLDKILRESMRRLLDSALENCQAAVIHVTHDPAELSKKTTRVVRLCRDKKQCCETILSEVS